MQAIPHSTCLRTISTKNFESSLQLLIFVTSLEINPLTRWTRFFNYDHKNLDNLQTLQNVCTQIKRQLTKLSTVDKRLYFILKKC